MPFDFVAAGAYSLAVARHHRRSIRLPEFDYRSSGAYFVTICTWRRECILDDPIIVRILLESWRAATRRVPVDYNFVVMPNHVHGIVSIRKREALTTAVGAQRPNDRYQHPRTNVKLDPVKSCESGAAPLRSNAALLPDSLGTIVRTFKSHSTRRLRELFGTPERPIWQRNYYERVIRDDRELQRAQQYILDNPAKWEDDPNHPGVFAPQAIR